MRFPGFIGPSYTLGSKNVDCQRAINWFPELNEIGSGKSGEIASFVQAPGLKLLATVAALGQRGSWTSSNGRAFAVFGNKLYEFSSGFAATERGTLLTSSGPVGIADNGIHLVVVDGPNGFVLTLETNSWNQITDEAWRGATHVAFQDGYFIFNEPGTGIFYISEINGISFDALDFATSEGDPDPIIGIISDHRDLWLFNAQTTEIFYNSGNELFPFERTQGAFIEVGLAAAFSIAKMSNSVFWLGRDKHGAIAVYMASGYQPQKVSTIAVDLAINSYSNLSSARAYTYSLNGHSFYVLNFPGGKTSWVYDTSTKQWHERAYLNNGQLERHRGEFHMYAFGKHVVGDYASGKLYELSSATYDDDGQPMMRRRVCPHISTEGLDWVIHEQFQLDMETGVGLDGNVQGSDPKVILEFSDDGGHTWSNEKWADIGKIGERGKRAMWRRLGMSRDRVYRITITDPVKTTLIGADLRTSKAAA